MKTRFSTYDLVCSVTELQRLIGMRVQQIYDIDNKTYLIKLQRTEEKCILLLESGNRMHTTAFEWPKNVAPSGFSMKMRKHLRNKRLECMKQLGLDRIVDLQFGTGEAAYHIILELYDRGNIILTDCSLTILYILRPHTEGEEIRFAVREKYPIERAHQREGVSQEKLEKIFASAKQGEGLKKILIPHLEYGPALIEHVLLKIGLGGNYKLGKSFDPEKHLPDLITALNEAEELMEQALQKPSKGYIIQKKEKRPLPDGGEEDLCTNQEFHPMLFRQHEEQPFREFPSFDMTVDEFFSTLEGQKIDMKALHQEREALKKLENVRKDHDQRLEALERTQETDKQRAELITRNQWLVDNAILAVRSALANQLSWPDIQNLINEAQSKDDPVASCIKALKLEMNHISLLLSDPYAKYSSEEDKGENEELSPMMVDIDLDLTAFSNARKYYDKKRSAAKKQQKTIESTGKALKSAEKKTKQTLKEVQAISNINKARKVYWFEKFFWFVSTENYLIIGGRDQQQNEVIVKRYMGPGDIYVHADIQGASSIVIKNPSGEPIPPKTLNEAGTMAVCYSVGWDAKVVPNAWWVHSDQVSKTAPTGEYLTTGSFMIRGKKNYLPPCHLIMGFSYLFKLEESSIFRHKEERRVRGTEEDLNGLLDKMQLSSETEQEIELIDSDGESNEDVDHINVNNNANENIEECEDGENTDSDKEAEEEEEDAEKSEEEQKTEKELEDLEEQKPEFPDTEIKIEHVKGNVLLHATTAVPLKQSTAEEEGIVFLGLNKPVMVKPPRIGRSRNKSTHSQEEKNTKQQQQQQQQQQLKRGQRGKLKKIKEKYKYQDEEERKLKMEILQSAGSGKEGKKGKKGKESSAGESRTAGKQKKPITPQAPKPKAEGEESEEEEQVTVTADVDMLDSLTGLPLPEDELLFAVPVVAPYNALQNYKFKVKLTPGTGKRGKAVKTAMNMFMKDKSTTPREKDLIRSVKDEILARNMPGKVKLSAPQLQKLRK